jgi:hypothetical protein
MSVQYSGLITHYSKPWILHFDNASIASSGASRAEVSYHTET